MDLRTGHRGKYTHITKRFYTYASTKTFTVQFISLNIIWSVKPESTHQICVAGLKRAQEELGPGARGVAPSPPLLQPWPGTCLRSYTTHNVRLNACVSVCMLYNICIYYIIQTWNILKIYNHIKTSKMC